MKAIKILIDILIFIVLLLPQCYLILVLKGLEGSLAFYGYLILIPVTGVITDKFNKWFNSKLK